MLAVTVHDTKPYKSVTKFGTFNLVASFTLCPSQASFIALRELVNYHGVGIFAKLA
jgi:hypothetical protein